MEYGYARCSTNETKQDIDRQVRELKAAGAREIFLEYEHGDAKVKSQQEAMFAKAAHGFFTQLGATAIKHKFIGKPLKIQIFHTKNTPVHWGKFYPIKQEYSLVQRKKFIGMKTEFYTYQSHLHCIDQPNKKAGNPLRTNQNCAASADLS